MTLKNNRALLLKNIKLCASFRHHMWIQTGVTVRKQLNGDMTSVTLTFDLCPDLLHGHHVCQGQWLLKISGWYDDRNIVNRCDGRPERKTDGQTDRQTEISVLRAPWSQLKIPKTDCKKGWGIGCLCWSGNLIFLMSCCTQYLVILD